LLERIVRQLTEAQVSDITITSGNPAYNVPGAKRYQPLNNRREIDRFAPELISDDCCFLYGDTFYTDDAMRTICGLSVEDLMFVGSRRSIVAVVIRRAEAFRKALLRVCHAIDAGELADGKGWQVYSAYTGQPLTSRTIAGDFLLIEGTKNIDTAEDYRDLLEGLLHAPFA
jgi:hypothetical protein